MQPHRWAVPTLLAIIALARFVRLSTRGAASLWCDEIGQVTSYYFDSYKDVMYWAARFQQPPVPLITKGAWLAVAVVLLLQLRIDHTTAIVHKPDWRAACKAIGAKVDPARDVVFAAEAQLYGTAGMVFRVSPHYWDTDEHLVNVLRDQDKLYNSGRPILDRRRCRVALILRCDPDLDGELLRQRLSKTSRLTFSVRDFHQFIVLISRPRFETADAGLLALADAVEQMLGDDHRDLGVHGQMARAWMLAKHGDLEQAAATYTRASQQVLPQYLSGFEEVYQDLLHLRHPIRQVRQQQPGRAPIDVYKSGSAAQELTTDRQKIAPKARQTPSPAIPTSS